MRDHVRPPRYTRKSVVRFRVYPTDASLFHCVHTYPLVVERRSYSLVLLFWGRIGHVELSNLLLPRAFSRREEILSLLLLSLLLCSKI